MSRKIDDEAYQAFINRRRLTSKNTDVMIDRDREAHMYLFGNEIAKTVNGETWISCGKYRVTMTTRSRLSKFVQIRKYKGYFIINEKFKWDGKWLNISKLNNN